MEEEYPSNMKPCLSFILATTAFALVGCATHPMVDYDGEYLGNFASYKTFDLAPANSGGEFREIDLSPIVDRIVTTILDRFPPQPTATP